MKPSRALGRTRLCIERLAGGMPLHAALLSRWRLAEDARILTMCIGFRAGKFELRINPGWIDSLTTQEIIAVLTHEVGHVLFQHVFREPGPVFREPGRGENRTAMMVAEETVCNDWALGTLPGQPILTSYYPGMSPDGDTIERYEYLREIIPDTQTLLALDCHESWKEVRKNGALASMTRLLDIALAWSRLTSDQRGNVSLPDDVREGLAKAGALSGNATAVLGNGKAVVCWRRLLRRFVGLVLERRSTYSRPSRRFGSELLGFVPGKARHSARPRVLCAIDTSASMTRKTLSDIAAEIGVMAKTYQVEVVEVDTAIRARYKFAGRIDCVRGRGGTDLRVVFSPEVLRGSDLLIVFSDMQSPFPPAAPPIPVVFAMCGRGRPVPYGMLVKIG